MHISVPLGLLLSIFVGIIWENQPDLILPIIIYAALFAIFFAINK